MPGMPADRSINSPHERIRQSLYQGMIYLLNGTILKGTFKLGICPLAARHHHKPASADVQPVHNPLTLRRPGGSHGNAFSQKSRKNSRPMPPVRRMRGNTSRFIDHHNIVIAIDYAEAIYLFGLNIGKVTRSRRIHNYSFVRRKFMRLTDFQLISTLNHTHMPVANPAGCAGTRYLKGTGESSVQSHTY